MSNFLPSFIFSYPTNHPSSHARPILTAILPVSSLCPCLSRRDPRVPWSVCHHLLRPLSSRAAILGAGWLRRSSWSGWSATRGRWFASARGTSARATAPARASHPPLTQPSAPPPPHGCLPAPPTLRPPYVTPQPRAAAADTGSTNFTTRAAMPLSSPQPHNNLARMLTH